MDQEKEANERIGATIREALKKSMEPSGIARGVIILSLIDHQRRIRGIDPVSGDHVLDIKLQDGLPVT